jgi:type I restriction enzyme M protein
VQKQAPRRPTSAWHELFTWVSQETAQPDATAFWAFMNALRRRGRSYFLVRDLLAVLLLLRWIDLQDAEQEAMAAFEDRSYQALLPEALRWRRWAGLDDPEHVSERLRELTQYVERLRGVEHHPLAHYLHALAGPISGVLRDYDDSFIDIVRWINELPFESGSERSAVLDIFDRVLAETGGANESQFSTPPNIARLVVALAHPQPGERVYDPCFGLGNFLVAAWRHAERSRTEQRRPGALLDVSGIEINPSAFLIALTRMLLAGVENPRLELGDSLERDSPGSLSRQGFPYPDLSELFGHSDRVAPPEAPARGILVGALRPWQELFSDSPG